jgi:hypothetical protein
MPLVPKENTFFTKIMLTWHVVSPSEDLLRNFQSLKPLNGILPCVIIMSLIIVKDLKKHIGHKKVKIHVLYSFFTWEIQLPF